MLPREDALSQTSIFGDESGEGAFKSGNSNIFLNAQEKSIKLNLFFVPIESGGQEYDFYKTEEKYEEQISKGRYSNRRILLEKTIDSLRTSIQSVSEDTLEVGDSAFRVTHIKNYPDNFGINLNAIANSGVSTLFDEGEFNPTGEIKLFYKKYGNKKIRGFDYFIFSVGGKFENISLIDTTNFSDGIINDNNFGYSAEFAYNNYGIINGQTSIWGLSLSYNVGDNAGDIKTKKYENRTLISENNNQTVTSVNILNGFLKDEYVANRSSFNVNGDWGIYPKNYDNRIVVAAHFRGKKIENETFLSNIGGGLYLVDDKNTTNIRGGINFLINDAFGIERSGAVSERLQINLVAGFKF